MLFKSNKTKLFNPNSKLYNKDILFIFFCFISGVILGTADIKVNGITPNWDLNLFLRNSWFDSFAYNFKYLFLIFILAFTIFGKIAIPSVFIIKGYFLSRCISSAIMSSGIRGFFIALIHAGVVLVVLLPILLVFSKRAIDVSYSIFTLFFGKKVTLKAPHLKFTEFIIIFFIATILVLFLSFLNPGIEVISKKYFT